MGNFNAQLSSLLDEYGMNGKETPAYFTFDHPTAKGLGSLMTGGLLSLDEAREMAKAEYQCTTAFVTGMDKAIDQSTPSWRT